MGLEGGMGIGPSSTEWLEASGQETVNWEICTHVSLGGNVAEDSLEEPIPNVDDTKGRCPVGDQGALCE